MHGDADAMISFELLNRFNVCLSYFPIKLQQIISPFGSPVSQSFKLKLHCFIMSTPNYYYLDHDSHNLPY